MSYRESSCLDGVFLEDSPIIVLINDLETLKAKSFNFSFEVDNTKPLFHLYRDFVTVLKRAAVSGDAANLKAFCENNQGDGKIYRLRMFFVVYMYREFVDKDIAVNNFEALLNAFANTVVPFSDPEIAFLKFLMTFKAFFGQQSAECRMRGSFVSSRDQNKTEKHFGQQFVNIVAFVFGTPKAKNYLYGYLLDLSRVNQSYCPGNFHGWPNHHYSDNHGGVFDCDTTGMPGRPAVGIYLLRFLSLTMLSIRNFTPTEADRIAYRTQVLYFIWGPSPGRIVLGGDEGLPPQTRVQNFVCHRARHQYTFLESSESVGNLDVADRLIVSFLEKMQDMMLRDDWAHAHFFGEKPLVEAFEVTAQNLVRSILINPDLRKPAEVCLRCCCINGRVSGTTCSRARCSIFPLSR